MPDTQNTQDHHQLHGLDHLRALAIVMVCLFHYRLRIFGHPEWVTTYAKFGWTGVDLFFVLSGFLISSQLFATIKAKERINYNVFFVKRFFRIVPAFWVVTAMYFCLPFFREKEALPPLWRLLTFTQNIRLNIGVRGAFSHAWSLCVEEHFYLALPLTLIILQRLKLVKTGAWLLAILFIGSCLLRRYSWGHFYEPYVNNDAARLLWYQFVYYPTYNRLDGLLAGVSIAAVYVFVPNLWSKISRYGNALLVTSLLILTAAYFVCYDEQSYLASVVGFPLVAIGYGTMVMGAVSPSSFLYKRKSRVTALIATLSYGVYLTHKGVTHMTQQAAANLGLDINGNVVLVLCAVTCLLFAAALYLIVERPFMRLRGTIMAKRERTEQASVVVP
jgi:peptidoglycan/LPS O-acetylase OafA/YrhL